MNLLVDLSSGFYDQESKKYKNVLCVIKDYMMDKCWAQSMIIIFIDHVITKCKLIEKKIIIR